MNRRSAAIIAGSIAVLAVVSLAVLLLRPSTRRDSGETGPEGDLGDGTTIAARIYYPGESGWLTGEDVEIPSGVAPEIRIRALLARLLSDPKTPGLQSPLPEDVELKDVYLSAQGIAFIDFATPEQQAPPRGGSRQELLIVYSIVNTVQVNVPEVRAVTLLWNGQQRESFSGHLDTTRPLRADNSLVAQAP